ncbi:sugar phosphate isomerase/epimerase family protein [Paenibacillus spongiae]|uniref:Sugar phosphate isomerase/epimerase n=1 Tax=Paenibacillus spongiae TaxID=2909671 RepID=A0ABY5SLT4_9BACL|nr:sugar phosphate isomerase/epimerase [Paenibacillus spongiae]UVI33208.1 sugar phosphate isomerase/epimerase [Paenibacillus spongiae]
MNIKGFSTGMYGWQARYWKDGKEPSWDEMFRDCAESGMDAVEIDPTPELAAAAQAHGLTISGTYVGLQLHEPFEALKIEESVLPSAKRLAEAGGTDLVINADPKGSWEHPELKTEEEFKRQGDNLARIAAAVKPLGLKVSLHNHAATKHNAEGDLRSVIDYSSPEVGLCIDTGWAHVAGINPIDWIRKYPERVVAFHFRNQNGAIPTEDLLEGEIDMKELISALDAIAYEGWLTFELLHQDDMQIERTMEEDVQRSVDGLKQWIEMR